MKKMATLMLLACMFAAACSSDNEDNGKPGFETTRVDFDCEEDSLEISSSGRGWILENVIVDGVNFKISGEDSRKENNFAWLTVKCSKDDIKLAATDNFDEERDFTLQIKCADGSIEEIRGRQKEATDESMLPYEGKDEIHMSKREGAFGSEGGTFAIYTDEGSKWYFQEILLYDDYGLKKVYDPSFAYLTGTQMEDILYSKDEYFEHSIEWFSVKRNENKLEFTIAPNESGKVRYFDFLLRTINYECWFKGCQSAD